VFATIATFGVSNAIRSARLYFEVTALLTTRLLSPPPPPCWLLHSYPVCIKVKKVMNTRHSAARCPGTAMLVAAGISNASGDNAKLPWTVPKAHSSDAPPQDPPTKSATSERKELCCCRGITLQIMHASRTTNKEIVYRGFRHLIGEAMREIANAISNNKEWREDYYVRGKLQAPHNGMPWKLRQFADFTVIVWVIMLTMICQWI
jgi:hypothetical protein